MPRRKGDIAAPPPHGPEVPDDRLAALERVARRSKDPAMLSAQREYRRAKNGLEPRMFKIEAARSLAIYSKLRRGEALEADEHEKLLEIVAVHHVLTERGRDLKHEANDEPKGARKKDIDPAEVRRFVREHIWDGITWLRTEHGGDGLAQAAEIHVTLTERSALEEAVLDALEAGKSLLGPMIDFIDACCPEKTQEKKAELLRPVLRMTESQDPYRKHTENQRQHRKPRNRRKQQPSTPRAD